MANKEDLIKLATSELGYLEKSAANYKKYGVSCLYSKTGYAGADNYTKYAYETGHYKTVGWAAWCETFISWLFLKAYGKELANSLLCGMSASASTMDVKNVFVKKGRQVPLNRAEAGDLVYRSRNGGGHVGIVVGRSGAGQIITIEGNSSSTDITSWNGGAVVKHTGASWEWCVRPDWSLLPAEPEAVTWKWVQAGDKYYYQNNKGENTHGWAKIAESGGDRKHWYYFNTKGAMQTGAKEIDGKYYFFWPKADQNEGMMCTTDAEGALVIWSEE